MKMLQFKAGDRLYDKRFGTGTVLAKREGAFLWVQFRGGEMSYGYFEALNLKKKPWRAVCEVHNSDAKCFT